MTNRLLMCLFVILSPGLIMAAEPLSYWVGASRVEAQLALDRLVMTANKIESTERARAKSMSMERRQTEHGRWRAVLRLGEMADRPALEQRAGDLKVLDGVTAVRAVLVTPDGLGEVTRRLAIRVRPGQDVAALLARYHLTLFETVGYSPDTVIAEAAAEAGLLSAIEIANQIHDRDDVVFATPLVARQWIRRVINDPLFFDQWHLDNTGQWGGAAGCDINILGAWATVLGSGVNIAIVDDGMQTDHPDLFDNARTDIDIDINYGDLDPTPAQFNEDDNHGTFVAGLAGARDNGVGGRGAAPRAGLVCVRLISAPADDGENAQAMKHQVSETVVANQVGVSSNSWGPSDTGRVLEPMEPLMGSALSFGVANGRSGKGVVYVWAGGNGRGNGDDSNYDNLANSRYVVAVGALRPDGVQASYSESGANLLVCAPGGGGGIGMVSTDRTGLSSAPPQASGNPLGYSADDYVTPTDPNYPNSVGTSFSTPLVSGVVALLLEANPSLTWRDVHHLLVRTAFKTDANGSGWITNGANRQFNHRYGFGLVDAAAAVTMATSNWIPVPPATSLSISSADSTTILDNPSTPVDRSLIIPTVPGFHAERVELQVNVTHPRRGDLHFQLVSPSAKVSEIPRRSADTGANFSNWTFTSVLNWGENPGGTWHVRVIDEASGAVGTLGATTITVYGYISYPVPTLAAVAPAGVITGSPDQIMTCSGSGFVAGVSTVLWNGAPLVTTVVSGSQITAVVPAAKFAVSGTATVTVSNVDFDGGPALVSGGQTVRFSVTPTITAVATASTNEDTPVAITLTVADVDTALGSLVITATSADQTKVANANLMITGTGTLTVTPAPDATGSVALTISVSDGVSSASRVVNLTIIPVNDPPVALGGRFRARVGTQLSDQVLGFDVDGDVPLIFNLEAGALAGLSPLATDGTFTFTPSSTGLFSFAYTVAANGQTSVPAQAFITVAGDPNGVRPLIVSEPSTEIVDVGSGFTYSVIADTRRYTVAPTLIYTLVGKPTNMDINSSTGVITWIADTPDRHVAFGIVVKDALAGGLDTQTVVLRIAATSATN